MRILHVVETLEQKADGVASFVVETIRRQREAGHEVDYWTADGLPAATLARLVGERGPAMVRAWRAVGRAEVVHLHALWGKATVLCGHAALLRGVPYVATPHGMLDPWALAQSPKAKRVARWLAIDRILAHAACLHVLCEPERAAVEALGLRCRTALLPVGIDPDANAAVRRPGRKVVFMGRIHPKKGLDLLAEAFSRVADDYPEWTLVIAGPDQAGLIPNLRRRLGGLAPGRVAFPGAVMGEAKRDLLAEANIFVLPSHSEGLPVAVLEAMAAEIPVLITRQCHLDEVGRVGAGLVCDDEAESLTVGLRRLMGSSEKEQRSMGAAGRRMVMGKFTAERVANQLASLYAWAASGGALPEFVRERT